MESVLKWFGFDVAGVVRRRRTQLEQQKRNDERLIQLPCQEIVAKYLLFQREQNRQFCQEYTGLSYADYYAQTLKHLDIIDTETKRLESVLERCPNPCSIIIEDNKINKMI